MLPESVEDLGHAEIGDEEDKTLIHTLPDPRRGNDLLDPLMDPLGACFWKIISNYDVGIQKEVFPLWRMILHLCPLRFLVCASV